VGGFALFLLYPTDGNLGIAVNRQTGHILAGEEGEGVYEGEEFPDVVGAERERAVEKLLFAGGSDALVFHLAGVTGAGGVDADALAQDGWSRRGIAAAGAFGARPLVR